MQCNWCTCCGIVVWFMRVCTCVCAPIAPHIHLRIANKTKGQICQWTHWLTFILFFPIHTVLQLANALVPMDFISSINANELFLSAKMLLEWFEMINKRMPMPFESPVPGLRDQLHNFTQAHRHNENKRGKSFCNEFFFSVIICLTGIKCYNANFSETRDFWQLWFP